MAKVLWILGAFLVLIAIIIGAIFNNQLQIDTRAEWIEHGDGIHVGKVKFFRNQTTGTTGVQCANDDELSWAMGYLHAMDRTVQMVFLRVIAQGRLSELLKADNATLTIDSFIRGLGFRRDAQESVKLLSPLALTRLTRYSEGINYYWQHNPRPLEFLLLNLKPEPWLVEDTLITLKIMCYLPLAEVQRDLEAFIFQSIQHGVKPAVLKDIFTPFLNGMDDNLIELYKKTNMEQFIIPPDIEFLIHLPKGKASNNWVLAPSRSESGKGLGASDPHLDTTRLPPFWYELNAQVGNERYFGITLPGVPAWSYLRSKYIYTSFTYGFMDLIDFFIEDIKRENGEYYYRRDKEWIKTETRTEKILRKGAEPVEMQVIETDICVIETTPLYTNNIIKNGLYLCRAWSDHKEGGIGTLEGAILVPNAKSVKEAQEILKRLTLSSNQLIVDITGNIGYQQTGRLPKRPLNYSGMYALPAWNPENHWQGDVPQEQLIRVANPKCGYLATANHNVIQLVEKEEDKKEFAVGLNAWMGYRIDRLHELFAEKEKFNLQDMKRMQLDVYSPQAENFMKFIKTLDLTSVKSKALDILLNWDLRYDISSKGAPIFNAVYGRMLSRFYRKIFGTMVWDSFVEDAGIFGDYSHIFDTFFLNYDDKKDGHELFEENESKEQIIIDALSQVLLLWPSNPPTWGEERKVLMKNVLFDGALPRLFGVDYEYYQPGNSGTLLQGSYFRSKGRMSTFAPSWRAVTDFSLSTIETALPGGPSGNPLSKFYISGIPAWLKGEYVVNTLD